MDIAAFLHNTVPVISQDGGSFGYDSAAFLGCEIGFQILHSVADGSGLKQDNGGIFCHNMLALSFT